MYELHVRITPLSSLIARIDSLESACHLAQLLRVTSGFRICVRLPDGSILGDVSAIASAGAPPAS